MVFVFGCDNAGIELKNTLREYLESKGCQTEDVGCFGKEDDTAYPLIAKEACDRITASGFEKRGILICGTGIGMCMTANKFKGIRAAVGHDSFSAERSILSNNGNVLCFGARVIGSELAKKITGEWITYTFKEGPSSPKVQAIIDIEQANLK
jgi:ribose 5-phosphate isomerase B